MNYKMLQRILYIFARFRGRKTFLSSRVSLRNPRTRGIDVYNRVCPLCVRASAASSSLIVENIYKSYI